jgi:hypothetical protein
MKQTEVIVAKDILEFDGLPDPDDMVILTLAGISSEAKERGRISGPPKKDQQSALEYDSWPELTEDDKIAKIEERLVASFDKLAGRQGGYGAVELDMPRNIHDRVEAIAKIVGLDTKNNALLVERLARFNDEQTVNDIYDGTLLSKIIADEGIQDADEFLKQSIRGSRLSRFLLNHSSHAEDAIRHWVTSFEDLRKNKEHWAAVWTRQSGVLVEPGFFTDERLLELVQDAPKSYASVIEETGKVYARLLEQFPHVPDTVRGMVAFEHGTAEHRAEMRMQQAQDLYSVSTKPDHIPEAIWWTSLYRARGDRAKLDKIVAKSIVNKKLGYEERNLARGSRSSGVGSRMSTYIESKGADETSLEISHMYEWGHDLIHTIIDWAEKSPDEAELAFETVRDIRLYSEKLGHVLASLTGEPAFKDALKGLPQRSTELLFAVAKGGVEPSRVVVNDMVADAIERFVEFFDTREKASTVNEKSMASGQRAYTTLDNEVAVSITPENRIMFTYTIPESIFESYGISAEKKKAGDRKVYIRIDFDEGQFTLDIGSIGHELRNPRFASTYIGETLSEAHGFVSRYRTERAGGLMRLPPRLHPGNDVGGHHVTTHFDDKRFKSKQHMKNVTNLLIRSMDNRLFSATSSRASRRRSKESQTNFVA